MTFVKTRIYKDLFSKRGQHAGWNVVQAATLLKAGAGAQSVSFVIYAALELRMAIEQLIFTIIIITQDEVNDQLLSECRKKDGLFRILNQVSPKYTLRCKFQSAAASVMPDVPPLAEWDIRSLLRYYQELSKLCHSHLVIRNFTDEPKFWHARLTFLGEVHAFLVDGLTKGTAVMNFVDAKISIRDLWEKYANKQISLEQAIVEMKHRNPEPSKPVKSQRMITFTPNSQSNDVPVGN